VQNPSKLSGVIITFNEEQNIGRCIDSLQGIVDEIVVVDSYSTDRTREICQEKNVQFYEHPFEGHIQQKNYALSKCEYGFVLSLDADEALDEVLQKSILEVKSAFQFDAYSFNRLTNYCGTWIRHCGWYPDKKIRLWNKNKGHWGGENPHDKVVMDASSSLVHLEGDLLHYSYYTKEDHFKQIAYFTDISSKAAFDNGIRSNFFTLIFKPIFKFFRDFILKRGFLDGKAGFLISCRSAYATYLKYKKIRKLQR
jgi:glycosyltransferase involved in cell wall biosynthesis